MSTDQDRLLAILKAGLIYKTEGFTLSSGALAHHFLDGKEALSHADDLAVAARAMVGAVRDAGIEFDSVGGLTLGADALAVSMAMVAHCHWFFVRKEPKNRGTNRVVEGHPLRAGVRTVIVDDVITSGDSILKAYDAVVATGASVVAAVTLADRSNVARAKFEARGVPYFPMTTYESLGIPPVEFGQPAAAR